MTRFCKGSPANTSGEGTENRDIALRLSESQSGKSKQGLSKQGLGPKSANQANKLPFGAISAVFPQWQGAEVLGPTTPKTQIEPEKAPFIAQSVPTSPIFQEGFLPDFP